MDPAYEAHCVKLSLINFWKLFLKILTNLVKTNMKKSTQTRRIQGERI